VDDDQVFKALADPTRRLLLDQLFARDGRTLTELESHLDMTRFGVAKHLRVLEEGGLVVSRKVGRTRLHYLNPVPIRELYERWITKYTGPRASALLELKRHLEAGQGPGVHQVFVKATPERVWAALGPWRGGDPVEADPPRRLVSAGLTWDIEPGPAGTCQLTLTTDVPAGGHGWTFALCELKTLVETGVPMSAP